MNRTSAVPANAATGSAAISRVVQWSLIACLRNRSSLPAPRRDHITPGRSEAHAAISRRESRAGSVQRRGRLVVRQQPRCRVAERVGIHAQAAVGDAGVQAQRRPGLAAGAGGDEEGQQMLVARVHPHRVRRAGAIVEERVPVARRAAVGEPLPEFGARRDLGCIERRQRRAEHEPEVVGDAAAAHQQHALVGERRERAAEREQARRRPVGREPQRQHRDVGLRVREAQRAPDTVVESAVGRDVHRQAGGGDQRRGAPRKLGRAGGVVAQAVERLGKAVEVVHRRMPGGGEQHRLARQRVRRYRDDRARVLCRAVDALTQAAEEGAGRAGLERGHRRAVRDEDRGQSFGTHPDDYSREAGAGLVYRGAMGPERLPVPIVRLAWRQTWRDLRAGELRLLMIAVVLAVAALGAVAFFADRLDAALARDARALLGGDAVIASDQPPPPAYRREAQALGLRISQSAVFPSMARTGDAQGGDTRLVALKAVDTAYPLRGAIELRRGRDAPIEVATGGPQPGEAWIDPALLDVLGIEPGDELLLGDASFTVSRLIVQEPDRGAGFMNFAPRVIIRADELDDTGLVQPASRITYRLAVAASGNRQDAVAAYTRWVQAQQKASPVPGLRLESLETGQPEMRMTLDRAQRFLNLVALLAALLAAVAVAIAARDFAQRHLDDSAMLRVLGAPQRAIAGAYAIEIGAIGALASLVGVGLGFGVHFVFVRMLANLLDAALPPATLPPALFGLGVGMTLLAAFGLPPLLQLAQVPALRVIRREVGKLHPASLTVLLAGSAGFAALLMAASADQTMGLLAVGGFAGAIAAFALLAWGTVALLRRVVPAAAPRALRLATRQLAAQIGR